MFFLFPHYILMIEPNPNPDNISKRFVWSQDTWSEGFR